MGKDCGSQLQPQCWPSQSPNLNCNGFVPVQGMANAFPAYPSLYNPCMASVNEPAVGFTATESSQLKTEQANEANQWFYCLPRQRQALTSIPKPHAKAFEPTPIGWNKDVISNARPVEKKFLVFNQCGNQTSLVFSYINGSPIYCPRFGNSESFCGMAVVEPRTGKDHVYRTWHSVSDELLENQDDPSAEKSEMHEDTEELNALLYSSDEDDEFDDETSSTGHSPDQMEVHSVQEEVNGSAAEVASSGGPTKRKRHFGNENYNSSSLMDTASSGKPYTSNNCEDYAESSCCESRTNGRDIEIGSSPLNKRVKRDRIRETITILQNIIPGGKGKDAMLVLDEAIQYLKSLKLKAKSLGEIQY